MREQSELGTSASKRQEVISLFHFFEELFSYEKTAARELEPWPKLRQRKPQKYYTIKKSPPKQIGTEIVD
jgi:hypothetical protein